MLFEKNPKSNDQLLKQIKGFTGKKIKTKRLDQFVISNTKKFFESLDIEMDFLNVSSCE